MQPSNPWLHCHFCDHHDPVTDEPRGNRCNAPTVEILHWKDGRVSPACKDHGVQALDRHARKLLSCRQTIESFLEERGDR